MLDVVKFIAKKNARDGNQFVLLIEIEYADGQFVRWARVDNRMEASIAFEGNIFTSFPIGNPRRSQNARAEIPTFDLPIANPEQIFQSILHNYIVEGRRGRVITVHRDHLDDPTAKAEEWFTIESASSTATMINVTCKSIRFNPRRARIPSRTMTRGEYPGLLGANRRRFN